MLHGELTQLVRVEAEDRCPIARDGYTTDFQNKLLEYERCYKGLLYDDPSRCYEWGRRYDPITQSPIPRELWKPVFMPQVGRELVDTQTANLVGKDRFPSIRVTSTKPLFKNLPIPEAQEGDDSTPEQRQEQAQANALQAWVDKVLELADLKKQAVKAVRWGLVRGEEPMLLRVHGKKPRLSVRNRTWCSWGYHNDDPDTLKWYREVFFFKRKVTEFDQGQQTIRDKWFLFVREIDEQQWVESEYPIERAADTGQEVFGQRVVLREDRHALGFVPVSIYAASDRQSMYDNGVLENVKHHIEGYNDRRAGTLKNMQPQWVVLKETNGSPAPVGNPGDKKPALRPGQLWELEGKSVANFSNQIEGYTAAGEMLDAEHQAMRASGGIIDIPPENEQSGRAVMLRLAPQFSATDDQRTAFGCAITDTATKTLKAAHQYQGAIEMPPDMPIPSSLDGIVIALDWGQMMPITPEVVSAEINNVALMRTERLMSRQTAQEYLLPLFNVDDIAGERARLAAEAAEEMEQQLLLAEAAMDNANPNDNEEDEDEDNG